MSHISTYIVSMRNRKVFLWAGIIALLVGCSIYLFFKQDIMFFQALQQYEQGKWLLATLAIHCKHHWIFILFNHLPDGLWYFGLLAIQLCILGSLKIQTYKVIFTISIMLPFIHEYLQYFKIVPGTYDIYDILTYVITLLLFTILIFFKYEKTYQ